MFFTNFRSLDLQTFRFQSRERDRHRNYHLRFYIPRAVSNSRIFFVFTGHGRKEEPCLLSQRTLKKKKEKKTTRTSRKCFVSRREWNSIDSIITYRSYSITRHSAKRTPINRSSIFISLFFLLFLIFPPLPSNRIISYTEKKSALHEKYTRRYNKTRGRFSFESREKYSHSRCPNKIVLETIAVAEAKP